MARIDSAEANNELIRIDKVLLKPHLLIGGLSVKHYYAARASKDIDLVCSDEVCNQIIKKLYPSSLWHTIEKNKNEYRPSFQIKNKKTNLTISFGPKILERDPYKDIDWDLILQEHSTLFQYNNIRIKHIFVPTAAALAYTKLLSFINRQKKDTQDLQDFIDLTNDPRCSLDELYNLIDNVSDKNKLRNDFWNKIESKEVYKNLVKDGNIFKFATFFTKIRNGIKQEIQNENIESDNVLTPRIVNCMEEIFLHSMQNLRAYNFEAFVIFVLQNFVQKIIGHEEGRFTIRKLHKKSKEMKALRTTKENAIPRPIPIDRTNMISESANRGTDSKGVPLIYSENKEYHYPPENTTTNENKDKKYIDYVTYCLYKKNGIPYFSVNLDVSTESAAKKLKILVRSQLFEIMCIPIIQKINLDYNKKTINN